MRAIPLLIILAVASAAGSLLFAAEPAPVGTQPAPKPAPAKTGSPQENADVSTGKAAAPVAQSKAVQEKDETEKSPGKSPEKSSEKPEPKSAADKASAADTAASPQRFIPSEQVRADFDVSFPVDI